MSTVIIFKIKKTVENMGTRICFEVYESTHFYLNGGEIRRQCIFMVVKSAGAKEKAVFFALNRVLNARELLTVEDCCLTNLDDLDFRFRFLLSSSSAFPCWLRQRAQCKPAARTLL